MGGKIKVHPFLSLTAFIREDILLIPFNKVFYHTYNVLEELIRNNSHNTLLQDKIENYLFNSNLFYNSNYEKALDINYSKESVDLILSKRRLICQYLDIMVDKLFSSKKEIKEQIKEKVHSYSSINTNKWLLTIVRDMSSLKITDILLSYSLKIIAMYPLSVKEMDCYSEIGLRV